MPRINFKRKPGIKTNSTPKILSIEFFKASGIKIPPIRFKIPIA
jgi:hypothetical protein